MKYLLTTLCALAISQLATAAEIRYLKLNDNAASTTVVATVGANGTLGGGDNTSVVQASGPGGVITYAFDLNGTDDHVSLGSADVYNFGGGVAWSVSLWFNADSISGFLIGRGASAFRGISFQSSTVIRVETSAANADFTVPTVATGTWYHLFVTKTTGNSCRLWINGTESSTGAVSVSTGALTFDAIGRRSSTYFNGRVSEFRLFDTDEAANVATYYGDGVSSSSARPQVIISQLLAPQRAWQRFISLTPIAMVQ